MITDMNTVVVFKTQVVDTEHVVISYITVNTRRDGCNVTFAHGVTYAVVHCDVSCHLTGRLLLKTLLPF